MVEETGMGGMMEVAWGLTLNDCAGSKEASNAANSTNSSNSSNSNNNTTEEKPAEKSYVDQKMEEAEAKREQDKLDWESGKTQAEGLQNSKTMQENKVANYSVKILKKQNQIHRNTVNCLMSCAI